MFKKLFRLAKAEGLVVAITTTHSGPYKTRSAADAVRFVEAWVTDKNVDIISPQLYSSGKEAAPQFD